MHEHERRLDALEERRVEAPRRAAKLALSHGGLVGGGPVRSGDLVVGLRDAVVGFPATPDRPAGIPIVRIARLEAQRGDRIGIVGPNGAGKTTLLRTIAGELAPLDGVVRLGAAVAPAYLAQVRDRSIPGATVLDALLAQVDLDNGPARARTWLASSSAARTSSSRSPSSRAVSDRGSSWPCWASRRPTCCSSTSRPTTSTSRPARRSSRSFGSRRRRSSSSPTTDACWRPSATGSGSSRLAGPARPAPRAAFEGGHRAWRAAVADGWTVAGELEVQSRRLDGGRVAVSAGVPGAGEVALGQSVASPARHSAPRSVPAMARRRRHGCR